MAQIFALIGRDLLAVNGMFGIKRFGDDGVGVNFLQRLVALDHQGVCSDFTHLIPGNTGRVDHSEQFAVGQKQRQQLLRVVAEDQVADGAEIFSVGSSNDRQS